MERKLTFSLILLVALVLTSCDRQVHTQGVLDFSFAPQTNPVGYFEGRRVAYLEDISINGYTNSVTNFDFINSMVDISGDLLPGDVIHDLTIDIDGVGQFTFPDLSVTLSGWRIVLVDSENNLPYYNFMSEAFSYMRSTGKQDIIVSGYVTDRYGNNVVGATVSVNILNNLDVSCTY